MVQKARQPCKMVPVSGQTTGGMRIMSQPTATVAIVETNQDIAEMLRLLLTQEGYRVVTVPLADLVQGQGEPGALLATHDPDVIIWDIGYPYADHWARFQRLWLHRSARGRGFILTTTNPDLFAAIHETAPGVVLFSKPYDLDQLLEAVRRLTVEARARRQAGCSPGQDPHRG